MINPVGGLTPNGLRLRIEELLKTDNRLVTETGDINYTKVHKLVDELDSTFIELLLKNEVAKGIRKSYQMKPRRTEINPKDITHIVKVHLQKNLNVVFSNLY